MGLLALPLLCLLHIIYFLVILARSIRQLIFKPKDPLPLNAPRRQIPKHLSILFIPDSDIDIRTTEQCILESLENVIGWCQQLGIERLSVYDNEGILLQNSRVIQEYFETEREPTKKETKLIDMVYPITPPASRPLSPELNCTPSVVKLQVPPSRLEQKRLSSHHSASRGKSEGTTTLYILSKDSSKSNIASVATSLAWQEYMRSKADRNSCKLSIQQFESIIEGSNGFPATDFMMVHPLNPSKYNRSPLELHGFPPWQMRLTEIYHNRSRRYYRARLIWLLPSHIKSSLLASTLTEKEFRSALDHFSGVEMRVGK
ncbi:hypothetical protein V5O48_005622 [Marasmius crinis-equi]|uniref:ditrans,polycis-polyprenyl diphosphate synthase [(2E,6E)-farnesyldiphosphate specific] n=1 Tax=Marasmius crinis-equi TaxID=585013 RepID=A0ABR3FLW3_9AGAR